MDTSRIGTEAIDLLSKITGQSLSQREVTPPVMFLAAMSSVLLGTIYVDGSVEEEEKRHLKATLKRFIPAEGDIRRLTELMVKGVLKQKLYKDLKSLLTLTETFSESEKLLLMSFGYQMSAADGEMHPKERQYLKIIATELGLQAQHLTIFEAGLTRQPVTDTKALAEVRYLLDPARFQTLDPIFVEAASYIEELLPAVEEDRSASALSINLSHTALAEFQEYKSKISNLYKNRLLSLVEDLQQQKVVPEKRIETLKLEYEKFDSKNFRITVVGDFSKGKSTLLNALLGAPIQPARSLPCSGTISILKYGDKKRVTCYYKDGDSKEISFDDYQEAVVIPKEAARGNFESNLSTTQIKEVVFETPDLELCRNGVEIVDSPGLNENPERTAITMQFLQDTDAVLFLTNAQNVLTESEQGLLDKIRNDANKDDSGQPQTNIFVVVNCIDVLDDEEDRKETRKRCETILSSFIMGEHRIHYLSAKQALNGILNNQDNKYVQDFKDFTDALEDFLTTERGSVQSIRFSTQVRTFIEDSLAAIDKSRQKKSSEIESQHQQLDLIEKIGEVSGRHEKIDEFSDYIWDQLVEQIGDSFQKWYDGLYERLDAKKDEWTTEHNWAFSRDKLVKDYIQQLNQDIADDLNQWIRMELKENILKVSLWELDLKIKEEIKAIKRDLIESEIVRDDEESNWIFLDHQNIEDEGEFGWSLGMIGLGIAVLIPGVLFGPLLTTILGVVACSGLAGGGLGGMLSIDGNIRHKVLEEGLKKFDDSLDSVLEKIFDEIRIAFNQRLNDFYQIVENAISAYENDIEQLEQNANATPEQLKAEIEWLDRQQESLKQVQQEIEAVLNPAG